MGEITKANTAGNWLAEVQASRLQLIEAAKTGDKLQVAFALADARAQLLATLEDPHVKARLLRITEEKLGLVELANNPTEDDRVRICAIAILSGLTPGDDEFAIFGGGKNRPGRLYLKEKGIRALFAQFGVVPEVSVGHPQYVAIGGNGKSVWRVEGRASVMWHGEQHVEEFKGPFALGINGYESDNVDGITAKARRKMLSALWRRVSGLVSADELADDVDTVVTMTDAPAIEHDDGSETLADNKFQGDYDRAQKRITDAKQLQLFNQLWQQVTDATDAEMLRLLWQSISAQKNKLGDKNVPIIQDYCTHRANLLKGGA